MDEQSKNSYENCIRALDELKELIDVARSNCFEPGYDTGLMLDTIRSGFNDISDFLKKQLKPPKSHPDYKKEVFDLILSKPIPGVESIEVNESHKKFVVHYRYQEVPTAAPMVPPVFHDRLIAEPKLTKE